MWKCDRGAKNYVILKPGTGRVLSMNPEETPRCECDTVTSRTDRCATRSDRRVKYYFFARERRNVREGKNGGGSVCSERQ